MPLFLYIYRAIEYKVKKKKKRDEAPAHHLQCAQLFPSLLLLERGPLLFFRANERTVKTGLLFFFFQARRDNGNKVKLSRCSSNNTHTHSSSARLDSLMRVYGTSSGGPDGQ